MRNLVLLAMLIGFAGPVWSADLTVTVLDAAGAPVRDAVVLLRPAKAGPLTMKPTGSYRLAQRQIQFDPFVLVVPVGAQVAFPNFDAVRHHVYSFSKPHPFELKLYGKDESRSVVFEKPGVIAVGCNIHDQMSAYILVTDTPYTAKTDATGVVVLQDAPEGGATLKIWHPYLKALANEISRPVTIPDGATALTITADIRIPPSGMHAH